MLRYTLMLLAIALCTFTACTSGGEGDEDATDSTFVDSMNIAAENTSAAQDTASLTVTEPEPIKEELKPLSADKFCECVRKKRDIEVKLEAAESDAEIDALLEELDAIDEGECKNLLAGSQSSAQARAEHQQKVAKCL